MCWLWNVMQCTVDLAVAESNSSQCQRVCVQSSCCGLFQITETWCGSLFPSDSQRLPSLLYGKTGVGVGFLGRGWCDGVVAHPGSEPVLAPICSWSYQPWAALPSTLYCSVGLYVCASLFFFWGGALWLIQKITGVTQLGISYICNCCTGTKSLEFTFKLK